MYIRVKRLTALLVIVGVICAKPVWAGGIGGKNIQDAIAVRSFQKTAAGVDWSEKYLLANKFVITRHSFSQPFEPYVYSDLPIFVTTDVVLNAFHILHRQSLIQLEQYSADRLKQTIQWIWRQIRPDAAAKSADGAKQQRPELSQEPDKASKPETEYWVLRRQARQRAQFVIAVAMALFGEQDPSMPEPLRTAVADETERIFNAENTDRPPTATGISAASTLFNYAEFRPVGLYTQSKRLQRYFRVRKWLQSVPFRVADNTELLAMLILGRIINDPYGANQVQRWQAENFLKCYRDYRGQKAPLDLMLAAQIVRDRPADLTTVRGYLAALQKKRRDRWATESDARAPGDTVFRILEPAFDVEAAFFKMVTAPKVKNRRWPSGLDLSAVLGSQTARLRLASPRTGIDTAALLKIIDDAKPLFEGGGIRQSYFKCLKALLDDPEPDAPFFMQSTVWRLKTINSAMASWVQFRQSLSNPGRKREGDTAIFDLQPHTGFVEPEPEFFSRLGHLADQHRDMLDRCGADLPARYQIAADLRWFADQIESEHYPLDNGSPDEMIPVVSTMIDRVLKILAALGDLRFVDADFSARRGMIVGKIRKLADEVEAGLFEQDPTYQALLLEMQGDLNNLWQEFSHICRQLEVIAHKQLRQIALNEREEKFMITFGEALANIMRHSGDRYRSPSDDIPIVIDFYVDSPNRLDMYAAVGRFREIIVLYPIDGQEIRCRGAVLPYYEFKSTASASPSDWIRRIESGHPPAGPSWLLPIFATNVIIY